MEQRQKWKIRTIHTWIEMVPCSINAECLHIQCFSMRRTTRSSHHSLFLCMAAPKAVVKGKRAIKNIMSRNAAMYLTSMMTLYEWKLSTHVEGAMYTFLGYADKMNLLQISEPKWKWFFYSNYYGRSSTTAIPNRRKRLKYSFHLLAIQPNQF